MLIVHQCMSLIPTNKVDNTTRAAEAKYFIKILDQETNLI